MQFQLAESFKILLKIILENYELNFIHIFNVAANHLYEEKVLYLIVRHNCTTYTSLEN